MNTPIKILIIDDSALVREILTRILSRDQNLKVVGTARDPIHAIKRIKEQKPDVITLDLEMPRMDGLTFLEKLMSLNPLPVVVISSFTHHGSTATVKALDLGAVDFVSKPLVSVKAGLEEIYSEIILKVKNAARVNIKPLIPQTKKPQDMQVLHQKEFKLPSSDKVIGIGASTGGAVAIKKILSNLPPYMPGIIIVLHMPAVFTKCYAERLDTFCKLRVKEAEDGEPLLRGSVYVAPGGKHLLLDRKAKGYFLRLNDDPPINHHRPSVDKTFFSIANKATTSMGIILTGMGGDGAWGLKRMKEQGAFTIVQDENSCVVYGMPREAIKLKAVVKIFPLESISGAIISFAKS